MLLRGSIPRYPPAQASSVKHVCRAKTAAVGEEEAGFERSNRLSNWPRPLAKDGSGRQRGEGREVEVHIDQHD